MEEERGVEGERGVEENQEVRKRKAVEQDPVYDDVEGDVNMKGIEVDEKDEKLAAKWINEVTMEVAKGLKNLEEL